MEPFEINQSTIKIKYIPTTQDCIPLRLKQYVYLEYESSRIADEYIEKISNHYKLSFFKKKYLKYFKKGFIKGFIKGINILKELYVDEEVSQERLEKLTMFLIKERLSIFKDSIGRIIITDSEKPGKYFTKIIEEIIKNEDINN